MLVSREARLASRCSRRWRWIYPTACFLAVALVASAVGVRSGRAQDALAPPGEKAADSKQKALLSEKDRAQLLAELNQYQQLLVQLQTRRAQLEAEVAKARSDLEAKMEQQLAAYQDQLRQLADKEEEVRERVAYAQAKAGTQVAESSRKAFEYFLGTLRPSPEAQPLRNRLRPAPAQTAKVPPTRAAPQPPAVAEQPAVEVLPFDLVNLAMAYVDALGDLDVAEARYTRLNSLRKSNVLSDEELTIGEANLTTAKRKVDLLQGIGISAIKAIKVEVETLAGQLETLQKQPEQSSAVTAARIRLARAESQLEILERIVSLR